MSFFTRKKLFFIAFRKFFVYFLSAALMELCMRMFSCMKASDDFGYVDEELQTVGANQNK